MQILFAVFLSLAAAASNLCRAILIGFRGTYISFGYNILIAAVCGLSAGAACAAGRFICSGAFYFGGALIAIFGLIRLLFAKPSPPPNCCKVQKLPGGNGFFPLCGCELIPLLLPAATLYLPLFAFAGIAGLSPVLAGVCCAVLSFSGVLMGNQAGMYTRAGVDTGVLHALAQLLTIAVGITIMAAG